VRHFLRDHLEAGVFDPGAVRILIAAFDSAWQSIKASGAKPSDKQVELMRATLAKYIIEQARHGELDQRPQGVGVKKNSRPCRLLPYLALRLVSKHASPAPVTVEDCRIAGFQAGASAKAIRHLGHQHALEDQLDFGGLLDRKIGQLLPLENPARPCDRPNDGLGVRGFHARSGAEATPRRTHRGVSAARPRLESLCIAVSRPLFSSNRNWNTWSVPKCGAKTNRFVLSVRIECAFRAVGTTCSGSPTRPSTPTEFTLRRFAP